MQIELTDHARQIVDQMLAQGRFQSAGQAIECALEFFQDCEPTMESLNAKLLEAHQDYESGRFAPLDMDEIKAKLQQRICDRENA